MFPFIAINEYEGKRRLSITGGLIGLALATPAAGGTQYYLLCSPGMVWLCAGSKRMADLAQLVPFAAVLEV
jgi:hypothetical protein